MKRRVRRIHFVGIGGIGMSGIAEVLLNLGYAVSGSDLAETDTTQRLSSLGARIHYGHRESNLETADVVVTSTAVRADNPEVQEAHRRNIPVIPRAEMLAELLKMKFSVAVSGMHGKTTTTSMVSTILAHGGLDPTMVIGGKLSSIGSNARLGDGEVIVAEADESDGSFLKLSPTIAVITNIDREHLDYYRDIDDIKEAFVRFANIVPFYGVTILCSDDEHVLKHRAAFVFGRWLVLLRSLIGSQSVGEGKVAVGPTEEQVLKAVLHELTHANTLNASVQELAAGLGIAVAALLTSGAVTAFTLSRKVRNQTTR